MCEGNSMMFVRGGPAGDTAQHMASAWEVPFSFISNTKEWVTDAILMGESKQPHRVWTFDIE